MDTHTLPKRLLRALGPTGLTAGAFAAMTLFSGGCNKELEPTPLLPVVNSTTPGNRAGDVAMNIVVTATFKHPMDAATINATTFTLKSGVTAIPAVVSYSGVTATLVPVSALADNTIYTATISRDAKDPDGQSLGIAAIWTFTTRTVSLPTVGSTGPANAAIAIPRNASVTATFSEAMNASTITASSFTLYAGLVAVPAVVSYAGVTATLNPSSTLAANTVYTATLSTGAQDLAGDHMAAAKVWTFTTVAGSVTGPGVVDLGTAINYVILAKSGVSTTGTTAIVGDVGLSPAAATFLTGFALTTPSTFSTSALVTGQLFAANYAVPTPANLTTAVLDMQTAYTDAAGRTLPDFVNLGAGNIQGLTLVPGLYKWGTGVSIPSAVTLSGGANDVWIFQVAQDLTVGNGAIVTLAGGAQAKNVFWQVAGQATLGTTANFKGIILSKTLISMNTGATVLGRALAQTAVTLNASHVTNP